MPPELAVAYAGEELQLNPWYMYSHLLVILLVIPLILARVREAMRVNCQKVGNSISLACASFPSFRPVSSSRNRHQRVVSRAFWGRIRTRRPRFSLGQPPHRIRGRIFSTHIPGTQVSQMYSTVLATSRLQLLL